MHRPGPTEYAPFYATYVAHVPDDDILAALAAQPGELAALLRDVPEAEAGRCHPPYTWTVKDVVGHFTDGERVFAYRALRFARGDATPLPGFDENAYAQTAGYDRLPLAAVVAAFAAVRAASLELFRHLPAEAWARSGEANGSPVSVRALAYILVGHARHHMRILKQRLAGG